MSETTVILGISLGSDAICVASAINSSRDAAGTVDETLAAFGWGVCAVGMITTGGSIAATFSKLKMEEYKFAGYAGAVIEMLLEGIKEGKDLLD